MAGLQPLSFPSSLLTLEGTHSLRTPTPLSVLNQTSQLAMAKETGNSGIGLRSCCSVSDLGIGGERYHDRTLTARHFPQAPGHRDATNSPAPASTTYDGINTWIRTRAEKSCKNILSRASSCDRSAQSLLRQNRRKKIILLSTCERRRGDGVRVATSPLLWRRSCSATHLDQSSSSISDLARITRAPSVVAVTFRFRKVEIADHRIDLRSFAASPN